MRLEKPDQTNEFRQIDTKELILAQYYEKKSKEAVMILEFNSSIITSMRKFYTELLDRTDLWSDWNKDFRSATATFLAKLQIMQDDFGWELSRARLLAQEAADLKPVVSLLEHSSDCRITDHPVDTTATTVAEHR